MKTIIALTIHLAGSLMVGFVVSFLAGGSGYLFFGLLVAYMGIAAWIYHALTRRCGLLDALQVALINLVVVVLGAYGSFFETFKTELVRSKQMELSEVRAISIFDADVISLYLDNLPLSAGFGGLILIVAAFVLPMFIFHKIRESQFVDEMLAAK